MLDFNNLNEYQIRDENAATVLAEQLTEIADHRRSDVRRLVRVVRMDVDRGKPIMGLRQSRVWQATAGSRFYQERQGFVVSRARG